MKYYINQAWILFCEYQQCHVSIANEITSNVFPHIIFFIENIIESFIKLAVIFRSFENYYLH